jgi:lysyl-tRNA synthetase class 2
VLPLTVPLRVEVALVVVFQVFDVDVEVGDHVVVAGRVLRTRDYGGVTFVTLRDWSGDVQLLLDKTEIDSAEVDFASVDLGDLIEVTGRMGYSRNGTRSVLVGRWRMLGKCLRPLPDKWKGLTDPEARVRARYVDLAINPVARGLIRARSDILRESECAVRFFNVFSSSD